MDYVPRVISGKFELYLKTFPAVLVLGPRQCGKSTFVKNELPESTHFDLERPADFQLISADPELLFTEHPEQVCIDESQRYPELFPVLRYMIDKKRTNGRFVLLGSAGPLLLEKVYETLAGRIGILELTPFTVKELAGRIPWLQRWWWGGLPPVYNLRREDRRTAWLESYIARLLERELPQMGVRVPAARLYKLWSMLTHVHGQLLNVSMLAKSLGLSTTTINNYLDILEGAMMITRLQPFFANIRKRLVKRPKLYIRDTGILHQLAGLLEERELETWIGRGNSFEGLVLEELMSAAGLTLKSPKFYFWRTQAGAEVDLLIQEGERIYPIEIKHGITVNQYDTAGLRQCMKDLKLDRGFIITRSESVVSLGKGIYILPWQEIAPGKTYPWTI